MRMLLIVALLLPAAAAAAATIPPAPEAAAETPASRVIIEGGLVVPRSDLAGDFLDEPLGFGATEGLELGFRWRWHLTPTLSLSPAFHFADFGSFQGENDALGEYRVECTTYRYTLEALVRSSGSGAVQPFAAVACGLFRNRVVGFTKTFERSYDESINTLGLSARAGIAFGHMELSVVYHLNRFSTWRYFATGADQAYDWDAVAVRAAWGIPVGR